MRNAKGIAAIVMVLLLLSGCLMPQKDVKTCSDEWKTSLGNLFRSDWAGWCLLGMFIALLLVSLGYMAGSALGHPTLIAWSKSEFYQVLGNFALLFFFIFFINLVCGLRVSDVFGGAVTSGYGDDFFSVSKGYLDWTKEKTKETHAYLAIINSVVGIAIGGDFASMPGGIGIKLVPFRGVQYILGVFSTLMTTLSIALLTLLAEIQVLRYIELGMLNIFFPLGLVLRCFWPTRAFGGVLMGIAVALFVFYPFMLVLNDAIIHEPLANVTAELNDSLYNPATGMITRPPKEAAVEELMIGDLSADSTTVWSKITGIPGAAAQGIWGLVLRATTIIVVGAMLLTAVDFIIVVAAAREISRLLGEEVDVSNLTRMI